MPIYAYRCAACGTARDVLRKLSDPPLTTCPVCGAEQFEKQVTAAGFQLKGSGWYVTDFRGGNTGAPADKSEGGDKPSASDSKPDASKGAAESGGKSGEKSGDKSKSDAKSDAAKPNSAAPATPAASSSGSSGSGSGSSSGGSTPAP